MAQRNRMRVLWLVAVALGACGKNSSEASSSTSHWVECTADADCADTPGAVDCSAGFCVDDEGDRISTSGTSSGDGGSTATGGGRASTTTTGSGGSAVGSGGGTGGSGDGGASSSTSGAPSNAAGRSSGTVGGGGGGGSANSGSNPGGATSGAAGAIADGGAGAGTGGSAMGGTGGGDQEYVDCPSSVPVVGSPCTTSSTCTWGQDPRFECRDRGYCQDGSWVVDGKRDSCSQDPFPAGCPSVPVPAELCDTENVSCSYEDGTRCICSSCNSFAPLCMERPTEWMCYAPQDGCPALQPNLGTVCTDPDLYCAYADCANVAVCTNGVWGTTVGCTDCNAPDTPIATPNGERPIADLAVGDLVYSVEDDGVVVVPIRELRQKPQKHHTVMRVELETGVTLQISGTHPLADGRRFSDLTTGGNLDGQRLLRVERVPYLYPSTFDILPDSSTGTYYAGGVLIGSTLHRGPKLGSSRFKIGASLSSSEAKGNH